MGSLIKYTSTKVIYLAPKVVGLILKHPVYIYIYIFLCYWKAKTGPGSSSGKALGYGLDGPGSIPSVGGVENFLRSFVFRQALRSTQPPINEYRGEGFPLPLSSAVAV